MNKHPLALLSLLACAAPALAGSASTPACTAQTTKGSWAYTCEGTLPAPTQTATRILGRCSASAAGYFDCKGSVNLGGTIIPQTLQGQATTAANCTGTVSYAQTLGGSPAGVLNIEYVVSEGGDAISGLPVNSGGVLSCALRRIGKPGD